MSAYGYHCHTRRGSFGLLVRDLVPEPTDDDDRLILTAAHLLIGMGDGARVLSAPRGPEPGSDHGTFCGTIRRRVPLEHVADIPVDAAVIKPPREVVCSNVLECGAPNGICDLLVVDDDSTVIDVQKHGAQTGLTRGQLLPIVADHRMKDMAARYSYGWWVSGNNGVPFADKGDSGSIVVDDAKRIVGMVVAIEHPATDPGTHPAAFVHGIKQIFAALRIALP